jgi:cleavage and polyadenylation specificity factor subunit 4
MLLALRSADDLALAVERQLPSADAKKRKRPEVCQSYQSGSCANGNQCVERHVLTHFKSVQNEVCRYWLRGSCANGDDCVFLHEYDERFVPECVYFSTMGFCTNPDCNFRHVLPEEKLPECGAFKRGFCALGPNCRLRHVKRKLCNFYMHGFCPLGPRCPNGHPSLQLYDRDSLSTRLRRQLTFEERDNAGFNPNLTCLKCLDPGHLPKTCPGVPYGRLFRLTRQVQEPGEKETFDSGGNARGCFICGNEGHTFKECPEKETRGARLGVLGVGGHQRYGVRRDFGHGGHQQHQHHGHAPPLYHGGAGGGPAHASSWQQFQSRGPNAV